MSSSDDTKPKHPELAQINAEIAAIKQRSNGKVKGPLVVHSAADISKVKPVRWAWEGRFVMDYLNLLLGAEGIGKGTLIAKIISHLSNGTLEGHLQDTPIRIGIVGDEDGFYDVWTPRLIAAGAKLENVVQLEQPDGGYITLSEDATQIATAVKENEIQFLYFDQLLDNLGVKVDDWRGKQVRDALAPVRIIGKHLGISVLATLHPNKHGDSFRELVSGSTAFNAVSRSSWLLAKDPHSEDKRVLVHAKSNRSELASSLAFEIDSSNDFINGHWFNTGVVRKWWDSAWTIDELLSSNGAREPSNIDMAESVITRLLPRDGKWHLCTPIYEECTDDGITKSVVAKARNRLGILSRRISEPNARAEWQWPAN